MSEVQDADTSFYHYLTGCRIALFMYFEQSDKSLNSKNESQPSSVYTGNLLCDYCH